MKLFASTTELEPDLNFDEVVNAEKNFEKEFGKVFKGTVHRANLMRFSYSIKDYNLMACLCCSYVLNTPFHIFPFLRVDALREVFFEDPQLGLDPPMPSAPLQVNPPTRGSRERVAHVNLCTFFRTNDKRGRQEARDLLRWVTALRAKCLADFVEALTYRSFLLSLYDQEKVCFKEKGAHLRNYKFKPDNAYLTARKTLVRVGFPMRDICCGVDGLK